MSFEEKIFEHDGFDLVDTIRMIFYRPTLKIDIGNFKSGTKFDYCEVNLNENYMSFGKQNEKPGFTEYVFETNFGVGKFIKKSRRNLSQC